MESSAAKTSVWWDIENCRPPADVNPYHIARNISNVLHAFNFFGPLTISAYGDTYQLSRHVQNALTSTGISLNHIPSGRKEASDKAILMNMAFWTSDNPPPANVLLISGDQDFSPLLHRLQMKRFNILLVRPEGVHVSESLLNSARTVWYWSRLARAEVSYLSVPRDSKHQVANGGRMENAAGPIARPPFMIPSTFCAPGMNEMRAPPSPSQQFSPMEDVKLFLKWPTTPHCFSGRSSESFGVPRPQQFRPGEQEFYYGRGLIRRALETLKLEMMLPTEANIYNCIVYGELTPGFNLRRALEEGVSLGELAIKNAGVGGAEQIFLPNGYDLWPYIDPNLCQEYDADIWNAFRNYLCSEKVHVFTNSANQYDAALVVRKHRVGRLSDLTLGQIYNVIQLAIVVRLWIKPHSQTWSPLGINISRGSMAGPVSTPVLEEKGIDVVHQASEEFVNTAMDVVNKVLEDMTLDSVSSRTVAPVEELPMRPPSRAATSDEQARDTGEAVEKQADSKHQKGEAPAIAPGKKHSDGAAKHVMDLLTELKLWLPSVLTVDGYDISLVRQDFKAARGLSLDHQALGYPKLLDLMKQFPDVVQISYPKPGLCKLYTPGTEVAMQVQIKDKIKKKETDKEEKEKSKDREDAPTATDVIQKLRQWLPEFISRRGVCDLASLCKEFEGDCKMKIEPSELGLTSMSRVLEQFSDIVRLEYLQSGELVLTSATKKAGVSPARAQIPAATPAAVAPKPTQNGVVCTVAVDFSDRLTADCRTLLLESIPNCKSGYPLARLKGDFQQQYGYALDHAACGFKKLETFLELLRDSVVIWTGTGGHKLLHLKETTVPSEEQTVKDEDEDGDHVKVEEIDKLVAKPVEEEEDVKVRDKERSGAANAGGKKRKKGAGAVATPATVTTSTATKVEKSEAAAAAAAASSSSGQSNSSSSKEKLANRLKAQLPLFLRYSFAERVSESSLTIKPTNPLAMVD